MSDPIQGDRVCTRCGQLHQAPAPLCPECAIAAADDKLAERIDADDARSANAGGSPDRRPPWKRIAFAALMALCVVVILVRIPAVAESLTPPPPVRKGRYTTSGRCNDCVSNLWHYGAAMQSGAAPPVGLTCPASGASYIVEKDAAARTIVSCPNPAAHDVSTLTVTSTTPIPDAR